MVAADDGSIERHRLDQRRAEPLVAAREHERRGTGDQGVAVGGGHAAGSDHPIAESEIDDRPADLGVGRTGATEQHQPQRRVGPVPRHHLEQQAMVLVGMRDRRVHDVRTFAEPVAPAHVADLLDRRRDARSRTPFSIGVLRTPCGTTTTRAASIPNASITVPRTNSLGVATTDARATDRGIINRR